jgi:flavin reductase (DIM6/NTAB) family NADH-FMN oxidoreductase RutF
MHDLQVFKDAMSQMATGVTIVTSFFENTNFGMTVSSFTSVSLNPPLVSICVDKRVTICSIIQNTKKFAVNILSHEQTKLGQIFSTPHIDMTQRFQNGTWTRKSNMSPVLKDSLAWIDCNLHSSHNIGDHLIFIGEVLSCHARKKGNPALYYQRHWHTILA